MRHDYIVRYSDVEIRPMSVGASELYRRFRNLEEVRRWFATDALITAEDQRRWFEAYLRDETDLMFSIVSDANGFVGGCSLYGLGDGVAEFGRLIVDPAFRGHGYGRKAVMASLDVGRLIGLRTIYLEVFADNEAAVRTYVSAGFVVTGYAGVARNRQLVRMEKRL